MTKVEKKPWKGLLFCFELSQFTQNNTPYIHTHVHAVCFGTITPKRVGGGGLCPQISVCGGYGTPYPPPPACSAACAQVELNMAFLFSQEPITRSEQLFYSAHVTAFSRPGLVLGTFYNHLYQETTQPFTITFVSVWLRSHGEVFVQL